MKEKFGSYELECYPAERAYPSDVYRKNGRHGVMHEYSRAAWGRKFYELLPKIQTNIGRIITDSRGFLCPVPISQSMEAVGYEHGLRHQVTLGVLWDFHQRIQGRSVNGNLIIDFSDSQVVTSFSTKNEIIFDDRAEYPIEELWQLFIELSNLYADKYRKYLHYTLNDIGMLYQNNSE